MMEVWPAILVAGVTFAIPATHRLQYARPLGCERRGVGVSMICLTGFLLIWHPKRIWKFEVQEAEEQEDAASGRVLPSYSRRDYPRLDSVDRSQRDRLCMGHADRASSG